MNHRAILAIFTAVVLISCAGKETSDKLEAVDFTKVRITDSFWRHRLDVNEKVTIPHAIKKCIDEGRVDNFIFAGGLKEGRFRGHFGFDDSDVYKVLEGMAYSYSVSGDKSLKQQMDALISYIAAAQQPDGYLYTPYTLKCRDYMNLWCTYDKERYDNLSSSHEFYNMGHLYEAAVAHYIATGQKNFLDIATKSADHIYGLFGPGKTEAMPGHEEIETGLLKLYRVTSEPRYLELAKTFMERRGHGLMNNDPYFQDQKPVVEQTEAVGHAVRANYLFTAMADYAALTGNNAYAAAVDNLWENVVGKKLYITGGMGSWPAREAYGENFSLPNNGYAETCAAIAGVYWNQRMFLLHGEAKYIDVLERILYNGLISGISLDGTRFFYPNVLSTKDVGEGYNSGHTGRSEWFDCSCCPTNDVRFISSVPGYFYAVKNRDIYVNLYVAGEAEIDLGGKNVRLVQETEYPWDGRIDITTETSGEYALMIRIPGWARNRPVPGTLYTYADGQNAGWDVAVNGLSVNCAPVNGYCRVARKWKKGDKVTVSLEMKPRTVIADSRVTDLEGQIAVECGPVVYCAEAIDNDGINIFTEPLDASASFSTGMTEIAGVEVGTVKADGRINLIPYFAWNHRGNVDMTVWFSR